MLEIALKGTGKQKVLYKGIYNNSFNIILWEIGYFCVIIQNTNKTS